MQKLAWCIGIVFGLAGWPLFAAESIAVEDDAGRSVALGEPAVRIVSLAPHVTELLFAAGAGDRVVAVSEFTTYPEQASRLPGIGGGAGLDLEAIVALQPDLVVAWQSGNSLAQLEKLEAMGLTLFYSEPRQIDAIASNLLRLGTLAGTAASAAEAARQFLDGVDRLREEYADRKPVTVFYQIWEKPLMTVNGEHMISAWLRLCGGENIFAGLSGLAPVVDVEAVLSANPQAIIAGRYPGKGEGWEKAWQRWGDLGAVAGGHLYTVDADLMDRQTPRALFGARELCAHIDTVRTSAGSARH